ncbi:MAG: hypothetical protein G8345_13445 [Magnetococcales bacterium]|nr:hypothetical protein [Magnetococcales bacterium]
MLKAVEAEVGENGQVRLREPLILQGWHRAVLTILEPLQTVETGAHTAGAPGSWHRHVGVMKDSPHFKGDPAAIQKAMRDEWS